MTKVEDLRLGIVCGLNYRTDDWDMGQGEEGAGERANEKEVDALISAVREEERARLEESYRKGEY